MATSGDVEKQVVPQVRQVTAELTAESRFPVPVSDGYSVYSSLLSVLSGVDEDVGANVHDSSLGGLHCSGLVGNFGKSDRPHHKTVLPDQTYDLSLGIVHPEDSEVFQALVSAMVLEGENVELSHGSLRVERFESENATHRELLDQASEYDDPSLTVSFETPTCIEEARDVTTMFPHRWSVFNSLEGKWNRSAPEELELDLTRKDVECSTDRIVRVQRGESAFSAVCGSPSRWTPVLRQRPRPKVGERGASNRFSRRAIVSNRSARSSAV